MHATREPAPGLDAALAGARAVVFVCSGNMVRSAFAEVQARWRGLELALASCATTFRNDRMLPETARALALRGVPRERCEAFRPTHVDDLPPPWDARLARVDTLVLGMTPAHVEALARRGVRARLVEELRGAARPLADPVLEGASFEATFERLEACVDALVARAPRGRDPSQPETR